MANKKFLEEYPLYRKFNPGWESFYPAYEHTHIRNNQLPKPAIHMPCDVCGSDQTFNMSNEYHEEYQPGSVNNSIHGEVKEIRYLCSACGQGEYVFLVHFGYKDKGDDKETEVYLEKVGQIPAWNISMDKRLESLLGEEHSTYYKKGLVSESQGYGIGAFAYFRRITEEIIDGLLDSIADLLQGDDKSKYEEALAQTKQTTVTQEKIDLVKDLLPQSLRPDGMNPLSELHSALSEGLHASSEEECLEYAEAVRDILVYLVNQVQRQKEDAAKFTSGMRKLLDKKTQKGLGKSEK